MFKGVLNPVVGSRAARRLSTVVNGSRRAGLRQSRETVRRSTQLLRRLNRHQEAGGTRRGGVHAHREGLHNPLHSTDSWTQAQADALAQEEANWNAVDPLKRWKDEAEELRRQQHDSHDGTNGGPRSRRHTAPMDYDTVNTETGNSIVQERFDALVHRALLRYGPPLPVDMIMNNKVISSASLASNSHTDAQRGRFDADMSTEKGADDSSAVYFDEVALKLHHFMEILRKEKPHFSVRDHCDGVPLALMVKNCRYLRAFGGKVNYMRFVRPLRADELPFVLNPEGGRMHDGGETNMTVLSLGKYKMRELPSKDGLRQGPQPWRYSYKMM